MREKIGKESLMKMVAMLSPILQDAVNWNHEAIRKLFLAANFGALRLAASQNPKLSST
jgi:hypothetical protein